MQAYQDYLNAYQQKTSLYNISKSYEKSWTNLIIYNTESNTQEEIKTFQIPEQLDFETCITQLPNGKLFCYGKSDPISGITVLIDVNGGVEVLPSGTPCLFSSCIYFNNSVYCFGGFKKKILNLSCRFDLDRNQWIKLTPMPKHDYMCSTIIFNGNIVISGKENKKILQYSIGNESFSAIPYCFVENKIKILISTDRLYVIECPGSICESEIGNCLKWKRIGDQQSITILFKCIVHIIKEEYTSQVILNWLKNIIILI